MRAVSGTFRHVGHQYVMRTDQVQAPRSRSCALWGIYTTVDTRQVVSPQAAIYLRPHKYIYEVYITEHNAVITFWIHDKYPRVWHSTREVCYLVYCLVLRHVLLSAARWRAPKTTRVIVYFNTLVCIRNTHYTRMCMMLCIESCASSIKHTVRAKQPSPYRRRVQRRFKSQTEYSAIMTREIHTRVK